MSNIELKIIPLQRLKIKKHTKCDIGKTEKKTTPLNEIPLKQKPEIQKPEIQKPEIPKSASHLNNERPLKQQKLNSKEEKLPEQIDSFFIDPNVLLWSEMNVEQRAISSIESALRQNGYYESTRPKNNINITTGYATKLLSGKSEEIWNPFICIVKKRIYKKSVDKYFLEIYDGVANHKIYIATQVSDMIKYKIINKEDKLCINEYACTKLGPKQRILFATGIYPLKDDINISELVYSSSTTEEV